ncbi:hypothetical protein FGU65_11100 [Methanoculleus sp. FWC-SCC1]|uniref:Uncharacterized protein n=1 Tax=Methanoculleus frigidifontis TaxID=2584085 RepID=A0ABT8MBW6_9EURY|nr:hypothetical protein [Methanoculleus sp. FWC-SCC1]MDN7025436.1 hypothetical protein [Methanoculleus sp. FWC-SCC1]
MALEETLVVYDPDDARQVVEVLRKKGIPVRLVRKENLVQSVVVVGRIRNLKAALEEEIARVGEDKDARSWLRRSLASLRRDEEEIASFLQQHPPGETIPPIMPKKDMPGLYKALRGKGAGDEEAKEEIGNIILTHRIFDLLEQNRQIERTEDGRATLRSHVDPADMVTTLPVEMIGDAGLETRRRYAIMTSTEIISEPDYRLEFSLEAIVRLNVADVNGLIDEMEVDLDSYDAFRENVHAKRTVISRVMNALEGHGTASADEIFAALQSDVFADSGDLAEATLNLDLDFVKGLLTDMRKIGMIRRKGTGYRTA